MRMPHFCICARPTSAHAYVLFLHMYHLCPCITCTIVLFGVCVHLCSTYVLLLLIGTVYCILYRLLGYCILYVPYTLYTVCCCSRQAAEKDEMMRSVAMAQMSAEEAVKSGAAAVEAARLAASRDAEARVAAAEERLERMLADQRYE